MVALLIGKLHTWENTLIACNVILDPLTTIGYHASQDLGKKSCLQLIHCIITELNHCFSMDYLIQDVEPGNVDINDSGHLMVEKDTWCSKYRPYA